VQNLRFTSLAFKKSKNGHTTLSLHAADRYHQYKNQHSMIKFSSLRKLRNKTIVGISLIVFVIAGCVDSKVQSVYYDKIVNGTELAEIIKKDIRRIKYKSTFNYNTAIVSGILTLGVLLTISKSETKQKFHI